MAKKQRTIESKSKKVNDSSKDAKRMVPEVRESEQAPSDQEVKERCDQKVEKYCDQDGQAPTKRRLGAARGVSSLKKVLVRKAQVKRFKIRYNEFGVPVGDTRCTLQSYIGHLARTMIPIDIESWPKVDRELKDKLCLYIKGTFKVAPESEAMVLKSAGEKWRQFKTDLTTKHVMPYVEKNKKLKRPPKDYRFVGQEAWTRFIAQRTGDKWLGSPKQPGGVECGYVVMRYMKEIIEDKEISFTSKWATKTRKSYTLEELDQHGPPEKKTHLPLHQHSNPREAAQPPHPAVVLSIARGRPASGVGAPCF
ncbi:hypothetical protein AgCh_036000 [Apium graveolens]